MLLSLWRWGFLNSQCSPPNGEAGDIFQLLICLQHPAKLEQKLSEIKLQFCGICSLNTSVGVSKQTGPVLVCGCNSDKGKINKGLAAGVGSLLPFPVRWQQGWSRTMCGTMPWGAAAALQEQHQALCAQNCPSQVWGIKRFLEQPQCSLGSQTHSGQHQGLNVTEWGRLCYSG